MVAKQCLVCVELVMQDGQHTESLVKAHPHVSRNCTGSGPGTVKSDVVGVHNGIIKNYQELKEKLLKHGYNFYSQTDTEVAVKLVDYYYKTSYEKSSIN